MVNGKSTFKPLENETTFTHIDFPILSYSGFWPEGQERCGIPSLGGSY
jgi:hypothetical protein